MNQLYPVSIKLTGRPCVVVGGGKVALQKALGLLAARAEVTVVSPELGEGLEELRKAGRIHWTARGYRPGDLKGAFLAFAAVDDLQLRAEVHREAMERGILFNSVDDDPRCVFHVPAVAERGDLKIAVSTGGKSPALAAELRDRISGAIDERIVRFLAALGELRPRVLDRFAGDPERRARVLGALVKSMGPAARATSALGEAAASAAERRKVYLVGAGPGDPRLLTLRAAELIESATVVYYDRLVGSGVLARIPEATPRFYVGKEVGVGGRPDTGELLVAAARAGEAVVRLKGGDPYIFGRGGEEMLALLKAEVPFEVVPGVSSLTAAPAAAGIPLTFRGMARELVVRSGYRREEAAGAAAGGGAPAETTYVYLMTIGRLKEIVDELLAEGLDPATPAAIVQRATLPDQRLLVATLDSLVVRAARAELKPPAMVIAGPVVRFAHWKEYLQFLDAQHHCGLESECECKET